MIPHVIGSVLTCLPMLFVIFFHGEKIFGNASIIHWVRETTTTTTLNNKNVLSLSTSFYIKQMKRLLHLKCNIDSYNFEVLIEGGKISLKQMERKWRRRGSRRVFIWGAYWGFHIFGGQFSEPNRIGVILLISPSTVINLINFPYLIGVIILEFHSLNHNAGSKSTGRVL